MSDLSDCVNLQDAAACARYYATTYAASPSVVSTPVTHDDNLQAVTAPGLCPGVYGPQGAGCCPMCPDGTCPPSGVPCGSPGAPDMGCGNFRECDGFTGARHAEYAVGGGAVVNADTWSIDPTSGAAIWLGPTGAAAPPPSWAPPPPKLVNGALSYGTGASAGGNTVFTGTAGGMILNKSAPGAAILQPMTYDPSSGWQLAIQTPPETQPGIPATTSPNTRGSVNTNAAGTASGTGKSQGGTTNSGATTTNPTPHHAISLFWLLAGVAVLFLL